MAIPQVRGGLDMIDISFSEFLICPDLSPPPFCINVDPREKEHTRNYTDFGSWITTSQNSEMCKFRKITANFGLAKCRSALSEPNSSSPSFLLWVPCSFQVLI